MREFFFSNVTGWEADNWKQSALQTFSNNFLAIDFTKGQLFYWNIFRWLFLSKVVIYLTQFGLSKRRLSVVPALKICNNANNRFLDLLERYTDTALRITAPRIASDVLRKKKLEALPYRTERFLSLVFRTFEFLQHNDQELGGFCFF